VALLAVSYAAYALNFAIIGVALFLCLIILIQRGKGGGLVGAFGGAGGSSAFGSRAGDAFTNITLGVAAFWVVLILIEVKVVKADAAGPQQSITGGASQ